MESQHISNSKDSSTGYLPYSEISDADKVAPIADKAEDYTVLSSDLYYNVRRTPWRRNRWERSMIFVKAIMVGLLVFSVTKVVLSIGAGIWAAGWPWGIHHDGNTECRNHTKEFKWGNITPSKDLVYTDCFDGHQCARLDVPMDWNSTDPNGERVAVAVVKLPAKVDVVDERYGGAIITNPGGPGGSGVGDLLRRGANLQKIVDASESPDSLDSLTETSRYFDIISFDPRGINSTTPHINCFNSNFDRQRWLTTRDTIGNFGSSNVAFGQLFSQGMAFSKTCSERNSSLLSHMNTAPVVADIVALIEAHGRWREKTAKALLTYSEPEKLGDKSESKEKVLARTAYKKGEEKLQYWGFSYGTLLGATFASLQPSRVHRVVIDGVVNATDYYEGKWLSNLQDTDQIVYKFGDYCHEAGPERCALWRKSPAIVLQDLEKILNSVWENPIAVAGNEVRGPEVITYSDVMKLIRLGLYNPIKNAQKIATFIQDLSTGNGTAFADYKADLDKPDCDDWMGKGDDPDVCAPVFDAPISSGISCTDAVDHTMTTRSEFADRLAILQEQSKWLGNMWAEITLPCLGWKIRPKWRFDKQVGSVTNHPILLIGNTYDCVTPLRNAFTTSSHFPGSVVLTQHSEGHCSSAAPSICTAKYVRQYFQTGKMPDANTTCEAEERMFLNTPELLIEEMDVEDKELFAALKKNSAVW